MPHKMQLIIVINCNMLKVLSGSVNRRASDAIFALWQSESIEQWISFIPLFLEDAGLLAAFTHHSHIVDYAPVDSLSCRLPASSMILGIFS
jgi:hypothetical protein